MQSTWLVRMNDLFYLMLFLDIIPIFFIVDNVNVYQMSELTFGHIIGMMNSDRFQVNFINAVDID